MNLVDPEAAPDAAETPDAADFRASEAFEIIAPARQTVPLVFASPHSGRAYPESFLNASRLDPVALRLSEDAFVDELFADVVGLGAPLIRALFPRAFIDVNREALELDPAMFEDALPDEVNTASPRVNAGLGTIARVVANGQEIYDHQLTFDEARRRIDSCYRPYHRALSALIGKTAERFGGCVLVDCHSMPSSTPDQCKGIFNVVRGRTDGLGEPPVDMVIGDCWGSACASKVSDALDAAARGAGFLTRRNVPYAGGHTTRFYGRPANGVHAVQIEIRRDLYMDEKTITPHHGFDEVRGRIANLARTFADAVSEIPGAG
ncbi:MAG: N-formylglutamate amidohydrolase [Rhodospirillales bacterium]